MKHETTRFWSKVSGQEPNECWPWQACRNPKGYGRFSVGGKNLYAHRVVWYMVHGPIPSRMMVCHHCDNPRCCNPRHLFLGDRIANRQDAVIKGRVYANEKLNRPQVQIIRRLLEFKTMTQKEIGAAFQISHKTIGGIKNGRVHSWTP